MKQNQSQKIKILKIWEILQFKTDLEHPLTTQEMIDELAKCNVSCERRSLYRDIETLIAN